MKHNRLTPFRIAATLVILGLLNSGCNLLDLILHSVAERCAAATFRVTTMEDRNRGSCGAADCSLREAISFSNTCPGPQSITITGGTYTLTIPGADEDENRTGDLDITDSVDITGDSHTTIDGAGIDRVFDIHPGATVHFRGGLVIQHGVAYAPPIVATAQTSGGGGIRNAGSLYLDHCFVRYNTSSDTGDLTGYGGGVLSFGPVLDIGNCGIQSNIAVYGGGLAVTSGAPGASLSMHDSATVNGNTGGDGGGLYVGAGTTATLTQFFVLGNGAGTEGGGIWNAGTLTADQGEISHNSARPPAPAFRSVGGGIHNSGTLGATHLLLQDNYAYEAQAVYNRGTATIFQSAIVHNPDSYPGFGNYAMETYGSLLTLQNTTVSSNPGGGILNSAGVLHVSFSTLAENQHYAIQASYGSATEIGNSILSAAHDGGDDTCYRGGGAYTSRGYNLDETGVCLMHGPGDQTGSPLLGPLTTDSGTMVHPLLPGSPALDTANPATCPGPGVDQRGVSRPQGGGCDRGAYEAPVVLPLVIATPETAAVEPTKQGGLVVIPSNTPSGQLSLTLIQNANCRRGPGTAYEVLTSVLKGQTIQLSGRNEDNTWWFTVLPGNNPCWISMVAGKPNGDSLQLPQHPYPTAPAPTEEVDCSQFKDSNSCQTAGCKWNANQQVCK